MRGVATLTDGQGNIDRWAVTDGHGKLVGRMGLIAGGAMLKDGRGMEEGRAWYGGRMGGVVEGHVGDVDGWASARSRRTSEPAGGKEPLSMP